TTTLVLYDSVLLVSGPSKDKYQLNLRKSSLLETTMAKLYKKLKDSKIDSSANLIEVSGNKAPCILYFPSQGSGWSFDPSSGATGSIRVSTSLTKPTVLT